MLSVDRQCSRDLSEDHSENHVSDTIRSSGNVRTSYSVSTIEIVPNESEGEKTDDFKAE